MKKILLALVMAASIVSFGGIFSNSDPAELRYALTYADAKNWDKTIDKIIRQEAYIDDWYGEDGPILYLRKSGIMKEKEFQFLMSLSQKDEYQISSDDFKEFVDLVDKYRKKMPRTFSLKNENIKDPAGLAKTMVLEGSVATYKNPSSHIRQIADPKDWSTLVAFSKKRDFTKKEVKELRKILNDLLKKDALFDADSWYHKEVSARVKTLDELNNGLGVGKRERNNINAKALYVAYPEFLSRPDRWGK